MNLPFLHFLKALFLQLFVLLAGMICVQDTAVAQLSIQVASLDTSMLPLVSVQMKALKNSTPVTLTDKNLFIVEDNRYTRAAFVSAPDGNGLQRVEWYSQLRSSPSVRLIVSDGTDLDEAVLTMGSLPFLAFFSSGAQERRISEYKFGNVAPGNQGILNLRIKIQGNSILHIDSLSTGTPFFKAEWLGGWAVPATLPGDLGAAPASIKVTFLPEEDKYYQDVVTIYYEGGATDRLAVYGNKIELEEKTVLQLLSPNGGEVLAPCAEFPIRWTGNIKEFPTIVEYSSNNGETWTQLATVTDTSYLWKVPDVVSDSIRVRVRQEFQRSTEGVLDAERSAAQALGFDQKGEVFLSAHENGKITEWNAQSFQKVRTLDINPVGNNIRISGTGYSNTGAIAVSYTQSLGSEDISILAIFKTGEAVASIEKQLPASFHLEKMLSDAQGRFFAMVPDFGREILLYNDAGDLLKTIPFEAPVTAANLSRDGTSAIVSLLNGSVEVYSLPDFSKRSSINLSLLPIIQQATLSPDATLLAVATQRPTGTSVSRESEIFIVDIASNTIIRHLSSPVSALFSDAKALAFNATGRSLILGYASNPRVSLWSFSKEDGPYSDLSLNLSGELSDVSFGPDGRFAIASAISALPGNLIYRRFTYPESDASDNFLRITALKM